MAAGAVAARASRAAAGRSGDSGGPPPPGAPAGAGAPPPLRDASSESAAAAAGRSMPLSGVTRAGAGESVRPGGGSVGAAGDAWCPARARLPGEGASARGAAERALAGAFSLRRPPAGRRRRRAVPGVSGSRGRPPSAAGPAGPPGVAGSPPGGGSWNRLRARRPRSAAAQASASGAAAGVTSPIMGVAAADAGGTPRRAGEPLGERDSAGDMAKAGLNVSAPAASTAAVLRSTCAGRSALVSACEWMQCFY